jgi:hypothetical protein
LFLQALSFCLPHCLKKGHASVVVVIDAYPEVDLGGAGVRIERFGESKNGIARGHLDCGEHGGCHDEV